jgi:ureidoglycolate lyase
MEGSTRYIPVEALTQEAFAPFGHVIGMSDRAPLAANSERSFWGSPELELRDGSFMAVYVELRMTDFIVGRLHRHRAFSQVLVPLGGKALIHVVAPSGDVPDLAQMRAFLIDGDRAVITNRGIWHRNPAYALATSASLILISRAQTAVDAAAQPAADTVGGDTDRFDLSKLTSDEIRLLL